MSKDDLCGQFFAALEKIHFFRPNPDGSDDPVQLEKASRIFNDAVMVWHTISYISCVPCDTEIPSMLVLLFIGLDRPFFFVYASLHYHH